jgi:hypothetical protein
VEIRPPADTPTSAQASAGDEDYLRILAGRLELERDGRSQALAAMLLRVADDIDDLESATSANDRRLPASNRDDASRRLSRNALVLSPEDGTVAAWLSFAEDNPAERSAKLAHWQQVEPWNLAPLLAALPPANANASTEERADLAEADTLFLRSLAPITGYDTKLNTTRHAVVAAVRRYPPTPAQLNRLLARVPLLNPSSRPLGDHDMLAMGLSMQLWSRGTDTPFTTLFRACKREALAQMPQRYAGCVTLGERLQQRSDSLIGETIGISLLRHAALYAKDRKRMAGARVMRNRLNWLTTQYDRVQPDDLAQPSPAQSAALQEFERAQIAVLMDGGPERIPYSEQDLMRAVLAAMGIAVEPPPGWRSKFDFPDERAP